MKKYIRLHQEECLLLLIMLVGAFLRFYNSANLSLTGDELASLVMLQDTTFKELIENGVRKDFHPALFQVLLFYWVDWFGISEGIIRVPFILAGIFSILFAYLIASSWFNKTSGLYVAASIAFLIFPLMHSQIARPYSLGLLFSLMSVWFWTLVLFKPKPYKAWKILGYCVSTALSMYTHYFSFFLVVIVAITGLFYLRKENYKRILGCAALTLVFFLPHFDISLGHLTIGGFGEEGWLGAPNLSGNWFWQYLKHCFNNSVLLLIIYVGIFIYLWRRNQSRLGFNKFHGFAILWFLTPYFVGYYYSLFVLPILQNSVLLFSFPFLIILVFSFVEDKPWNKLKTLILLVFLGIGLISTVVAEKFYSKGHFGVLKNIVQDVIAYSDKYGAENITNATNVGLTYFVDYYLNKYDRQIVFQEYDNGLPPKEKYVNQGNEQLRLFQSILDRSETPFFSYSWSSKYSPVEIPEMIRAKYPYLLERSYYFNAESYLFGQKESDQKIPREVLFSTVCDFEKPTRDWKGDESGITQELSYSGSKSFNLSEKAEYSLTFSDKIQNVFTNHENVIHITVWGYLQNAEDDATLVLQLESPDGETYAWRGLKFSFFVDAPNTWTKIYQSWRFDYIRSGDDIIKVFVWNHKKSNLYIDDLKIEVTGGNPDIYGKKEKSF